MKTQPYTPRPPWNTYSTPSIYYTRVYAPHLPPSLSDQIVGVRANTAPAKTAAPSAPGSTVDIETAVTAYGGASAAATSATTAAAGAAAVK